MKFSVLFLRSEELVGENQYFYRTGYFGSAGILHLNNYTDGVTFTVQNSYHYTVVIINVKDKTRMVASASGNAGIHAWSIANGELWNLAGTSWNVDISQVDYIIADTGQTNDGWRINFTIS